MLTAIIIVFVVLVFTYGSYYVGSGFYLKAVCRLKNAKDSIALTFDDGPHPRFTPLILELLKAHNATAAFFCTGKSIDDNPGWAKQIAEQGHIVGNHTYGHSPWFDFWGVKRMTAELQRCDESILRETGSKPLFFRPPYGVTTPSLGRAVRKMNYSTIGWSIRSYDTTDDSADVIFNRIKKQIRGGDIVLLHDNREVTVAVVKMLLEYCSKNGIKIVRIDKMIRNGK